MSLGAIALDEDCDWFDTRYVLVLDIPFTRPLSYHFVYEYEVYDIEYDI